MNTIAMPIRQAAEATGLSERSIRKLIDEEKLPAKKYGTRILVRTVDLEAWVESLENARS